MELRETLSASQVSPNRRCLNQLNSWSEYEAAVNGATIAPPPRDWKKKKFDTLIVAG